MRKGLLTILLGFICAGAFAAAFTTGNIVVVRVGDGTGTLSSAAAAVFLDEYTITGTLVQSVALPTAANGNNHIFTLSGSSTSEGQLALSVNGQYLSLIGYDAATGTAAVNGDSTVKRTIARIGNDALVNTTTGINANIAYKRNANRGAVTNDGSAFWISGTGSGTTGGTWYVPFGAFTATPVQISSTVTNTRGINIFGGQLYTSSASGNFKGISAVGTGLPTTTGQVTTVIPGLAGADTSSSDYGFIFVDASNSVAGVDVLYIADDGGSHNAGGIYKYSLVGGTWVSNGHITGTGLRGLAGAYSSGSAALVATSESAIYTLVDASGYNQTITGTLTSIATAATNKKFRGVALAPAGNNQPLQASANAVNSSCGGASNGSVNLTVTGGTSPYTFHWSNSATTQNLSNLGPGSYTVTVSDGGGASVTASASVTEPTAINISSSQTNASCFGGTGGSITLTVSGGQSPYNYNWGSGVTTQNISNATAGNYTVIVTDNHNCTASATYTLTQPTAINVTANITNLPCTGGGNTGAINITATGGNGGFTYTWSNAATTEDLSGLTAGPYTVTVIDNSSCTATFTANISNSGTLTITDTINAVTCNGGHNGSINVGVSGQTGNVTYAWSSGSTSGNINGLSVGPYILTVTDQGGCTLISSFNVTQPTAIVPTTTPSGVSCHGGSNGSVSLNVNGGTSPYTFVWSTTSTLQSITGLAGGDYTVTITDAATCTVSVSTTVAEPTAVTVSGVVTNVSVFGGTDGAIVITAGGGTGSLVYTWSNSSTTQNLTAVGAGNYCITVSDANSCTASQCFDITQPTGITETDLLQSLNIYVTGGSLFVNAELTSNMKSAIEVNDLTGRMIYSGTPITTNYIQAQLPITQLSSAVYIVRILTSQGSISRKVVITK